MKPKVLDSIIIAKDDFAYLSHPTITCMADGEWLSVFNHTVRRKPRMHPIDDPLYRHLLIRSDNHGKTWSLPSFVPGFDWYGVECPGVATIKNDVVVLSQWRWSWYTLGEAEKLKQEELPIWLYFVETGWTLNFGLEDFSKSKFPYARGNKGLFLHFSSDHGKTFDRTVQIDTSPYLGGFTRSGVVQLSDGRIAYALGQVPEEEHAFIVFSEDGGNNWNPAITIGTTKGFSFPEPHIAEVGPNRLICILRDSGTTKYLHSTFSEDGGKTWGPIKKTPMLGHPGHLLTLRDGRLLCTYGFRTPPFGIRACLSEDGGKTWRMDQEIIVRDDLPNDDLGYPTTIEYEDNKIFVCYYGQDIDGVTCIHGTYIDLD